MFQTTNQRTKHSLNLNWHLSPLDLLELYPSSSSSKMLQASRLCRWRSRCPMVSKDTQAIKNPWDTVDGRNCPELLGELRYFFPFFRIFVLVSCPFSLPFAACWSRKSAISMVCATFCHFNGMRNILEVRTSHFPWYLHRFGPPTVHVASKVKGWFRGLFGAGLVCGLFYSCFKGVLQGWFRA